ncbi:hypothetical protein FHG87_015244 [Trinorchestia longiramus]|nr:hypothetical protein FHG87_015244 [Trinorchestia longiramus]
MLTKSFELPTEEQLTVEEVNISTPALRAGAFHLGKYCETPSQEFMLCRFEEKDPRKCFEIGKEVTACGLEFFRKVKKECLDEFTQFANCLDKSSVDFKFSPCRNTQAAFDKCMLEKLEMNKPGYGYYCRAKVLKTDRPRPPGYITPEFPNAAKPIVIPPYEELPEAKHGSRFFVYP